MCERMYREISASSWMHCRSACSAAFWMLGSPRPHTTTHNTNNQTPNVCVLWYVVVVGLSTILLRIHGSTNGARPSESDQVAVRTHNRISRVRVRDRTWSDSRATTRFVLLRGNIYSVTVSCMQHDEIFHLCVYAVYGLRFFVYI